MATIFERKRGKGKLYPGTDAETSIELPETESMLGLLGRNPARGGDRFAADGLVYNERAKPRKWFSYCEGWNHFWKPILDDVKHLEGVYYKLGQRATKRWGMMSKHLELIMSTTKPAKGRHGNKCWPVHAQPTRPENQQEGMCWVYEVGDSFFDGKTPSYVMDWVELPKKFRHLELGNQLYALEQLTKPYLYGGMGRALDMAFQKYLKEKYPELAEYARSTAGKMYELRVNGRHYVYRVEYNRSSVPLLQKHVWAGEEYNVVEV